MHSATLVYTVERANQSAADLQFAMQNAPLPLDMLRSLGIWIETDAYTTGTLPNGNPFGRRTLTLILDRTTKAQLSLNANGNNQVTGVNIVAAGAQYGGQPLVNWNSCWLPAIVDAPSEATAFPFPDEPDSFALPQFLAKMKVDSIVVPFGGSNYVAPVVTISGGTMIDGTPATAHATVGGGVITGIVVDTPGSGYCTAPLVIITDPDGVGAYGMATLNIGAVDVTSPGNVVKPAMATVTQTTPAEPPAVFPAAVVKTTPAAIAVLSGFAQAALQSRVRMPVMSSTPVIT